MKSSKSVILLVSLLLTLTSHSLSNRAITRRAFAVGSVFSPILPVYADVTNKLASSAALRTVKSSQKKMSSLEDYVTFDDYAGLKGQLRIAPFSEIRKSCSTLVRGGEDGPDAEALTQKYKTLISSLEKMDSTASLGMRGRKIPEGEFLSNFKAFSSALDEFLSLAEDSAAIPVQYE